MLKNGLPILINLLTAKLSFGNKVGSKLSDRANVVKKSAIFENMKRAKFKNPAFLFKS